MPRIKYKSLVDLVKHEAGVWVSIDSHTWIVYQNELWTTYQRPYAAKKTRVLYQGEDILMAIHLGLSED